jgi:hypothetical protein
MAKTDLSVKIGAEYIGKAAFAKAEKSITRLGKQVAGLALGGGILNFGISSVKAFYESEKSAKALYGTLNNLGMAFKAPEVNKYIDKLSLATGIVDETLNPAFQSLLLVTRDINKSQSLLATALDISAGTGYDLKTVTNALGKAYQGNATSLGKLNTGLTKAQLSAMNFDEIQKALNSNFEGQAALAASGYTGDIDKLKIAFDQLKESIGKGIVEGLSSGGTNIDKTTEGIVRMGNALGVVSGNLARFATGWTELFTAKAWTQFWNDLTGKSPALQISRGGDQGGAERAAQQKLDKAQQKTAVQQLAATKALTAEQKRQAQLKKAGTVLDIDQAQILIALQGKISDNEKLRLQLQLALLEGNSKEADRLSNELLLSQARTTGLATFIANLPKALNPFADYPQYVLAALAEIARLQSGLNTLSVNTNTTPVKTLEQARVEAVAGVAQVTGIYENLMAKINATTKTSTQVNVQVDVGGQQLTDVVTTQQINNSASGSQSRLNRLALMD